MTNESTLPDDIQLLDSLLGVEARKWGNACKLPSALRVTEKLEPVGGWEIPVFPASHAGARDNDPPVYDLNGSEEGPEIELRNKSGGTSKVKLIIRAKQCTLDSYQSQANRMEPAFLDSEFSGLVPQATVAVPRKKTKKDKAEKQEETKEPLNLLELAHRVGDFRVRLSEEKDDVAKAIKAFEKGDALPLLRDFPTSLLFGFWDSRGDQAKHARILMARIDAFDVIPCRRHSLYSGMYSKDEFAKVIGQEIDKKSADKLSELGFTNAPSSGLGGVLARKDGITRTATLSLTDLARIRCAKPQDSADADEKILTEAARRYLFCIGALAESYQRGFGSYRLRSGCELIPVGEPAYELRGPQWSDTTKVIDLCKNASRLKAIAQDAAKALHIETAPDKAKSYTLTPASLKKAFEEAKKAKPEPENS